MPSSQSGTRLPFSLVLLWVALIGTQALWLSLDRRPFAWDESVHYMGAVGYYRILDHPGPGMVSAIIRQSDFYPPLQEFLTGALFLVTRPSPQAASLLNLVYLIALTWLLWRIGRRLFEGESGVTAAWLTAASPMVLIQSKYLMLDIPLAFWVVFGAYAFLRSERLTRTAWAVGYGAICGAALLTKWSAVFFLAVPPLGVLAAAAWRRDPATGRMVRNLLAAGALAGLIAAPWYGAHLLQMLRRARGVTVTYGETEGDPDLSSPLAWVYYLGAVVRQCSWPLGLALLGGLGWFVYRRRHLAAAALWLAAPVLAWTLIRNKDGRYTLPLLPFVALAAVSGLEAVPEKTRRRISAGLAAVALIQILLVNFGGAWAPARDFCARPLAGLPLLPLRPPEPQDWPLARILGDVKSLSASLGRPPVLRVIPDHSAFTRVTFVVEQSREPEPGAALAGSTDWPAFTDFAVTKTGGLALPFLEETPRRITAELAAAQNDPAGRFELVRRYPLPDGSEALLYRRRDLRDPGPPAKILDELHLNLTRLLNRYLRDARNLSLEIIPVSPEQTLVGRFQSIRVRADSARVGDFAHKDFGVTLRMLDLELSGLALDLQAAREGRLMPFELEALTLNHLELDAATLNQALAASAGPERQAGVGFENDLLLAAWSGKPAVVLRASLAVAPDREHRGSDNLRFTLRGLRVGGVPVPVWMLQPMLEDFNPLLKLAGLPSRVSLGRLTAGGGVLTLGRAEAKKPGQESRVPLVRNARSGYN